MDDGVSGAEWEDRPNYLHSRLLTGVNATVELQKKRPEGQSMMSSAQT